MNSLTLPLDFQRGVDSFFFFEERETLMKPFGKEWYLLMTEPGRPEPGKASRSFGSLIVKSHSTVKTNIRQKN